jgi:hypothetical protein
MEGQKKMVLKNDPVSWMNEMEEIEEAKIGNSFFYAS